MYSRQQSDCDNAQDQEFEQIYSEFESKVLTYKINGAEYQSNLNFFVENYCSAMITGVYNNYGLTEVASLLFYSIMPLLNLHDLAEMESVPKVSYRRFYLTNKGKKYALFLEKKNQNQCKMFLEYYGI